MKIYIILLFLQIAAIKGQDVKPDIPESTTAPNDAMPPANPDPPSDAPTTTTTAAATTTSSATTSAPTTAPASTSAAPPQPGPTMRAPSPDTTSSPSTSSPSTAYDELTKLIEDILERVKRLNNSETVDPEIMKFIMKLSQDPKSLKELSDALKKVNEEEYEEDDYYDYGFDFFSLFFGK